MTRPLLILFLVWALVCPPLLPAADSPRSGSAPACGTASCCEIVETTTCCGERIVEQVCGMTGGECRCGAGSENADPGPEAPRPRDRDELVLILLARVPGIVIVLDESPPALARAADPEPRTTHNETQALLCVWRT